MTQRHLVLAVDSDPEPGLRALKWLQGICRPSDVLHICHIAMVMSAHIEVSSGYQQNSYEVQQGSIEQARAGEQLS